VNRRPGEAVRATSSKAVRSWAARADGENKPYIVGEFGACERVQGAPPNGNPWDVNGDDPPRNVYPNLMHAAVWAGLATGGCFTPIEWSDGKEFGEMRARPPAGDPFWAAAAPNSSEYPFNNHEELDAIRIFCAEAGAKVDPGVGLKFSEQSSADHDKLEVYAAASNSAGAGKIAGIVWLYNRDGGDHNNEWEVTVHGLAAGQGYRVRWYNTWTGAAIGAWSDVVNSDAQGKLTFAIEQDYDQSVPAAGDTQQHKYGGKDIACKIKKE
jgi:hypothetical protein